MGLNSGVQRNQVHPTLGAFRVSADKEEIRGGRAFKRQSVVVLTMESQSILQKLMVMTDSAFLHNWMMIEFQKIFDELKVKHPNVKGGVSTL